MRTLSEIIDDLKDGGRPSYDELRWSVLALTGLSHFDKSALRDLGFRDPSMFNKPKYQAEESHRRWLEAWKKSPRDWVGPNNDPDSEDVQALRSLGKKVIRKVLGDET